MFGKSLQKSKKTNRKSVPPFEDSTLFLLFRQKRFNSAFENLRLRDTLGSALGFE